MNSRILLLAGAIIMNTGHASAQAVLDANDPVITEKPRPDYGMRIPKYPDQSFKKREEGDVSLTICVNDKDRVVSGDMWKSSGYPALDDATINWIRSAPRWRSARIGDKPVAVCNYNFTYAWGSSEFTHDPIDPTKSYLDWKGLAREERPSIATQVDGPNYPKSAEAKGIGGPMQVSLCISPYGRMVSASFVEGVSDKDLMLALSVWLGRFTFNPGKKGDAAIGVCGFPVKYDW